MNPNRLLRFLWLLFAQCVTVTLAAFFVISTLRPNWVPDSLRPPPDEKKVAVAQAAPSVAPPIPDPYRRNRIFALAVARAMPSIVSIYSTAPHEGQTSETDSDILRLYRYFSMNTQKVSFDGKISLGSGIIVSQQGYILTNLHVIEHMKSIHVRLSDERTFPATVRGIDRVTDLAVIEIKNTSDKELPVISFGSMNDVMVGDTVFAIGNPFGLSNSVSMGIVSALGRGIRDSGRFENFIQTDASINPGNSGGALIDLTGSMIGINRAIFSQSGGSLGIGFATPVSLAQNVMKQIIENGEVVRGWLGIEAQALAPEAARTLGIPGVTEGGVIVANLPPDSPAKEAGVLVGDIIVGINDTPISNLSRIFGKIEEMELNTPVLLHIWRRDHWEMISMTIEKRDDANSSYMKGYPSSVKVII